MIYSRQPAFGNDAKGFALHDTGVDGLDDVEPGLTMHQLPPGCPFSYSHKARGDIVLGLLDRGQNLC
jgi:hypothetical protein